MGGPVGTPAAPAVAARVAAELGLAEPVLPWHDDPACAPARWPPRWACSRARWPRSPATSTLLAQQEVGRRPRAATRRGGGSSAMAHKRNPVAAVSALACAKRVPGLVATMLAAMEQEHERAAGAVAGRVGDAHRAAGG